MSEINWPLALGWGPSEIDDLRSTAYAYVRQGIYDVAITFFNALTALTPLVAYDLQMLGALHLQLGNSKEALSHINRALKLDPSHIPTQLNRAKALIALGQYPQGIAQARAVERQKNKTLATQATSLILSVV